MVAAMLLEALKIAIQQVVKYVGLPIKRQFVYIFCFNANNERFTDATSKLNYEKNALQQRVAVARRNAESIIDEVNTWLQAASEIQTKAQSIESEISVVQQNGCFTTNCHYSLSKRTVKITDEINELLQKSRFPQIAIPANPAAEDPILIGKTPEFPSRDGIENEVREALKKFNLVGICGMGGVGKTTLAKKLMNVVLKEGLFKERVFVTISQEVDLKRIQVEIADQLGLEKMKNVESPQERAHILHARINGRKILIVIDDIWEELNLLEIGIPCESASTSCTVLFTSRNRGALKNMKAQIFEVNILTPEEAWSLFKDKAGTYIEDPNIRPLAEDVAKECQGLPIALVTIGSVLQDGDKATWEDALQQLKTNIKTNLHPLQGNVYPLLRLSYDFLKDEDSRSLLLLCCMFLEDCDINIEMLTICGMGLKMFVGVDTLLQARNRVKRIVSLLKNHSLLLDGENMNAVRMHDVVRDVAIFIASDKGLIDRNIKSSGHCDGSSKWISEFATSREDIAHLLGRKFPNLHFLLIVNMNKSRLEIDCHCLLEGAKSLNVLCLSSISSTLLHQAMNLPNTLQTLLLEDCNVRSISLVGKLPNLEILICDDCEMIEELPIQIGELTLLKLLHLTRCKNLKRIVPGVLSKLVKLEELHVFASFNGWESMDANEDERMNASLKELELLTKLNSLSIQIANLNLSNEEICLPRDLKNYNIQFGESLYHGEENKKFVTFASYNGTYNIASWIRGLVRKAEGLHIEDCGPEILIHLFESVGQNVKISGLESLIIRNCKNMKELFHIEESRGDERRCVIQFQKLKVMKLDNLPNLTTFGRDIETIEFPMLEEMEILDTPKLGSLIIMNGHNFDRQSVHCLFNNQVKFDNLQELNIQKCDNIKGLFSSSSIVNCLVTLTRLNISDCKDMETVIMDEKEMHENFVEAENERKKDGETIGRNITFPKLKYLSLDSLESLMTFNDASEIGRIDFPSLEELRLKKCKIFKYMITSSKCEDGRNLRNSGDNKSLHLFCKEKVKFDKLRDLSVIECAPANNLWCQPISPSLFNKLEYLTVQNVDNIRSLFSFSIANSLVILTRLNVSQCKDMKTIIVDEKEMHENFVHMKNECEKDGGTSYHITFPKLVTLRLEELPSLMTFSTSGIERIDFPSLEELEITNCPKLKYTITVSESENGHNLHNDGDNEPLHLFCNKKVKFDKLRDLSIIGYASVNNLWCQYISPSFFNKLEFLRIRHVDNIRGLFSFSIANSLVTLTRLNISECKNMEAVIVDEKKMHENIIDLKNESKKDLPHLMTCSISGIERIDFSSLKELEIRNCPKLKYMITSSASEDGHNLHNDCDNESLHLFCNEKVKFGELKGLGLIGFVRVSNIFCEQFLSDILKSLEVLNIRECNNIKSLFSTSIAQELDNLQSLSINGCMQMEKVIVEGKEKNKNFPLAFPNLKILDLEDLRVLHCVFNGALQLPLLEVLEIISCPRMEFLSFNSASTPELERVNVDYTIYYVEDFGEIKDLNAFVRRHIAWKEKESTSYGIGDEIWTHETEDDDLEVQPTLDDNDALDTTMLDGGEVLDLTNEEASIEKLEEPDPLLLFCHLTHATLHLLLHAVKKPQPSTYFHSSSVCHRNCLRC